MRRPKGIKTKKSVAKRFKITAGGKVLRSRAGKRHLLHTKNPKRRRGVPGPTRGHPTGEYRIKQSPPLTHLCFRSTLNPQLPTKTYAVPKPPPPPSPAPR